MSRYQPYPNYKDSGVNWLGEVPEHWEAKKLKYNLSLQTQKITISGQIVIALENIESKSGKYIATESSYQGEDVSFKSGDILFGKLRPYLAKVYKCDSIGVAFGDLLTYRPTKDFDSSFAFYSLLSDEFIKIVDSSTYGTKMPRASSEFINEMILPTPSYEEQTSIANFLDIQTTKIDTLIAKQQRMIELLGEKRSALISHAVTKGIDPDVAMKDSGAEWLGEVPEHWRMTKLKFIGEAIIGLTYSPNDVTDEENGILVLRSSNVQNKKITFDDNVYVNAEIPKRLLTQKNDILICSRNGSRSLIGKNAMIDVNSENLTFGAFMTMFRTPYSRYVFWVLNSAIFKYQSGTFLTATINQLTTGNLNNFDIPFPSNDEQTAIANYLDIQTAKIDTLIAKARQAIELMKERRTALISAAVTGKIDVRKAV